MQGVTGGPSLGGPPRSRGKIVKAHYFLSFHTIENNPTLCLDLCHLERDVSIGFTGLLEPIALVLEHDCCVNVRCIASLPDVLLNIGIL